MATRVRPPRGTRRNRKGSASARTPRGTARARLDREGWLELFDLSSAHAARLRAIRGAGAEPSAEFLERLVGSLLGTMPLPPPPKGGEAARRRALREPIERMLATLIEGRFDEAHLARRRRLGLECETRGIPAQAVVAAYARFGAECLSRIVRVRGVDPEREAERLGTFVRVLLLDLGLVMEGYLARTLDAMAEHSQALEREVEERTRALAESERKYRQVVENARDIIWAMDLRGRITLLNKGITGYSRELLLVEGRGLLDRLHTPESLQTFNAAVERVRRTGRGMEDVPTTHVNPFTEEEEHYLSNLQPVFDAHDHVVGVQGISHDVTERRRLEANLRRSEERYREVIENAPEMIHQVDAGRRFLTVNRTELKKLGYRFEELARMRLEDLVPPEMREPLVAHFRRVVERGQGAHQTVLVARAGTPVEVEMNDMALFDSRGELVAVVSLLQDISERKALESQILRAERLAAIGELTASFAHEVGTPLSVILARAEYLMDGLASEDPNRKSLEVIATQIDRIKGTLSRLLEFSRGYEPKLATGVSVEKILSDVIEVLEHQLGRAGIELKVQVEPGLPGLVADPHQLAQVFVNLLMNSIQAIPGRGEITVRATYLGEQSFLRSGALVTAPLVRISVGDSGAGIPRENLAKIFTPFFSTRARGQGTGLGLCVVDRIVRNHGGIVSVQSEVGKGSTFTVDLPLGGPEAVGAEKRV